MPELLLSPSVVEMITALISVVIAMIALWEMRRTRREAIEEYRDLRREFTEIRERLAAIESKRP